MRFYIDFDDCLCETARAFTGIAARLFGKRVPYEKIRFFDLRESFALTEEEYEQLMEEGHRPEVLLAYEEVPGAARVLNEWIDLGHEIFIITGRPSDTSEASRKWLDEHGLHRTSLFFFDKYGRDTSGEKGRGIPGETDKGRLSPEEYYRMRFDYAIEDSPGAFRFFNHLPECNVMVYDRPWNRECELPGGRYIRCSDWEQIREQVREGNVRCSEKNRVFPIFL